MSGNEREDAEWLRLDAHQNALDRPIHRHDSVALLGRED